MPLYEYECTKCGHRTELLQRYGDPPLEKCPECAAAVRKLFSAPAVQFKGTGWYVTDYAGKGKQAPAGKSGEDAGKPAGKSDKPDKPKSSADGSSAGKTTGAAKGSGSKE